MSYKYRTRSQQKVINLKLRFKSLKNRYASFKDSVNEMLYSTGIREAPEVDWTMALPTPQEVSN